MFGGGLNSKNTRPVSIKNNGEKCLTPLALVAVIAMVRVAMVVIVSTIQ